MSISAARSKNIGPVGPPFLHSLRGDLARVEEVLAQELISAVRTVADVSSHILEAGGKRLRPSLVLLSARACGNDCDLDRAVRIAAGTEILHMATLIHDDVIDSSDSRRGRTTANSIWGNQVSVLSGDYMLAKAFSILARDGDVAVMQTISRATIAMTEGEISQIESRGDTGALSSVYLSIIHDKTAAFMSACCRIGGILAGATGEQEESLAKYGIDLGMAFQITDDLLDLVGDPAQTGKPVGGDIREGKITMPLMLTLERVSPEDRSRLEDIIHGSDVSSQDIEFVRTLAEQVGAVEGTREAAALFAGQAIEALQTLPQSNARDALCELTDFILRRKK